MGFASKEGSAGFRLCSNRLEGEEQKPRFRHSPGTSHLKDRRVRAELPTKGQMREKVKADPKVNRNPNDAEVSSVQMESMTLPTTRLQRHRGRASPCTAREKQKQ